MSPADRTAPPDRKVPEDPLPFIVRCVSERRIYWTYHVNMRLAGRHISREDICEATDTYEIVGEYPDDKYLPSYLRPGGYDGQGLSRTVRSRTSQMTAYGSSRRTDPVRTMGNPTWKTGRPKP